MLKLKVLLLIYLNVMCQKKVISFDRSETTSVAKIFHSNRRSLSENVVNPIVFYAPSVKKKNDKPFVGMYENSYNVAATQIPKVTKKPNSFTTVQNDFVNKDTENALHAKYSYNYAVIDGSTGDSKAAWEERDGNTVRGEYSVLEADGSIRTVTYTADDQHGFNAIVTKIKPSRLTSKPTGVYGFLPSSMYKRPSHRSHY